MKPFFAESGLSSTSANHYANMAKEVAKSHQSYLDNVVFYSTDIAVIGMPDGGRIREGIPASELPKVEETIDKVGKLYSLSAWLREAIKERERLSAEAQKWEDEKMREEFGKRREELESRRPVRGAYIGDEEVKEGWTIGEQEKYLSLESEAAWLGKYIHEDGAISKARTDLLHKVSEPRAVAGNGRDTIIYTYTPTVEAKDVDDMFFRMQAKHREVQAELNGMKKRIVDAISEDTMQKDEAYRLALSKWNAERDALVRELQEAMEDESKVRKSKVQKVAELKIVVPKRLEATLDMLKNN